MLAPASKAGWSRFSLRATPSRKRSVKITADEQPLKADLNCIRLTRDRADCRLHDIYKFRGALIRS